MTIRSLFPSVACSLALLAPVSQALAVDQVGGIAEQAARVVTLGERAGYTWSRSQTITGTLPNGYEKNHRLNLRRGTRYKIAAVCDNDCRDLDLKLYDENGNLIDKDFQSDDVPIVDVQPRRTATFKVVVQMESCHVSPCGYSVVVMKK